MLIAYCMNTASTLLIHLCLPTACIRFTPTACRMFAIRLHAGCLHAIYMLSTRYSHVIYTLLPTLWCLQLAYCLYADRIVFSYSLLSYCLHAVSVLFSRSTYYLGCSSWSTLNCLHHAEVWFLETNQPEQRTTPATTANGSLATWR